MSAPTEREHRGAAPAARAADETSLHRVMVVGGGAGGIELATHLGRRLGSRGKAEVTLVDRNRTHLWKPLLQEVAAGSMGAEDHEIDYLAQAHWHGFRTATAKWSGSTAADACSISLRHSTRTGARSRRNDRWPTTRW